MPRVDAVEIYRIAIFAVHVCDSVGLCAADVLTKEISLNNDFTAGVSLSVHNSSERKHISIYDCRVLGEGVPFEKKDRT